ncbi:MAG TPA: metal-sensitive transcriptional regulator [Acidimicrobiia bacterium]|nr:metal-sensitive transcriptional regulator [Acidimicrobiia bacterium]
MQIPDEKLQQITARLRRVEGQVRGIQGMLADGRDCAEIVTQFAAASKALEQAGFQFFAATLAQCTTNPDAAADEGYTADKLERLFLQLS